MENNTCIIDTKSRKRSQNDETIQTIIIMLLSIKIVESFLSEHLVAHCEKLNLFRDQQSTYRSNRCATDNLPSVIKKQQKVLYEKVPQLLPS